MWVFFCFKFDPFWSTLWCVYLKRDQNKIHLSEKVIMTKKVYKAIWSITLNVFDHTSHPLKTLLITVCFVVEASHSWWSCRWPDGAVAAVWSLQDWRWGEVLCLLTPWARLHWLPRWWGREEQQVSGRRCNKRRGKECKRCPKTTCGLVDIIALRQTILIRPGVIIWQIK